MSTDQLSRGGDDGTVLGQSTSDLIALYGGTPIAQPSGASQAAVTTATITAVSTASITAVVTTLATTTTPFGFTGTAQFNALLVAVNDLVSRQAAIITAVNDVETRLGLSVTQGNAIRSALVPTTGIGAMAGA